MTDLTAATHLASKRIAIVGASVAGVAAAEALSKAEFKGSIDVFDADPELPYDRPPLSKQFASGDWNEEKLRFHDQAWWQEIGATLRLGCRVAGLEASGRRLRLADGSRVENDGLVIATGAEPVTLECLAGRRNVSALRTLADGRLLGEALRNAHHLAIIGSGFIGLEVAAIASSLGLKVTVIEMSAMPMGARLGVEVAKRILSLHERHGIRFRCGRTVVSADGSAEVRSLTLDDGTTVNTDHVLVGVGVRPALEWLRHSGIVIDNGIFCDAHGRTSLPAVYAAGDAASWMNPLFAEQMRVEHWTTAREQGQHLAPYLLRELYGGSAEQASFEHVPYVWSDQYGLKIQIVGRFMPSDTFRVDHDEPDSGRFAGSYWRGDKLRGGVAINMPKQIMSYRKEILSQFKSM
ncbi:FAD-dependent oxidoreductase [Rhizobium sp. AQ_MP]|uniref:FAD-dependent oxidoreductase n=1 Tax=Rhizobium sp. AQ_MP TaxID=2761536 RepID=UPI001639786A|nr:FAD-dependent oxidoreductase [Rhizobium sp. AQ_MP]